MDMHNVVSAEPDNALGEARKKLKVDWFQEKALNIKGAVVEIVSYPNGKPGGYIWFSGKSFAKGDVPVGFDYNDMNNGQPWLEDIQMAIWLFGPSRVEEPLQVYRWLNHAMADGATFYMTTQIPWSGKMPLDFEFGQYSDEETHAALVRTGFNRIGQSVNGPYFRLWNATKSKEVDSYIFQRVEKHLNAGNWRVAVELLGQLDEKLDSLAAVREYALLLAACHDLAGNTKQSYAALSETLRLDPECGRAMCGLGRLAALNGDFVGASIFFESALKKTPCLVAALRGHAAICEMVGDVEQAYKNIVDASNFRPMDENLLFEVIRLGNTIGLQDKVALYLKQRNEIKQAASIQTQEEISINSVSCPMVQIS